MRRVAASLSCTEGQAYTAAIGVFVAVLLAVTGLPGTWRDLPATPAAASPVAASQVTTPVATTSPRVPVPSPTSPGAGGTAAAPSAGPAPAAVPATPAPTGSGDRPSGRADEEPPPPCDQASVNDGAAAVLGPLDALAGGGLPDASTLGVLAALTGCSAADPALAVVGVLIEIGDTLPDTGLDGVLPALPALQIPAPVVALAPSLEPVLGPICQAGSTAALLVFIFASHYPAPLDDAFLRTSNGLLALCAQLQPLPPPD